ncbi:MAG: Mitochondrial translocator assembly and maintenance protein 41 [Chrysothrix sp. TS-e1954]|nr:MAG: Mitochondrial translocator assembly and maintenance protein 41 [Chrysothrix sp. TS-e1954]
MTLSRLASSRIWGPAVAGPTILFAQTLSYQRPLWHSPRLYATEAPKDVRRKSDSSSSSSSTTASSVSSTSDTAKEDYSDAMPANWEDDADYNISAFSQLPNRHFGFNQHMVINAEFKEALRQVLWQFRAPIRYAFAYGSGVFPQSTKVPTTMPPSPHPSAPEAVTKWQSTGAKSIDFIFGVSYTQHWHSLNLNQHRDHYSFLGSLGSGVVSRVQDRLGAGAYYNPYLTINGMSIKYGVVNLDTLHRDLSEWDTLYLAGRLQKPVKILRDDARIRLANQVNLISAVRTALLLLPQTFTERDLYSRIAGLSYMGDPRMQLGAESPDKVTNIVDAQMTNFRQLYSPLVEQLPNISFTDAQCSQKGWMTSPDINSQLAQDMDPQRRGNMVRRLPQQFRRKLYKAYKGAFELPQHEFEGLVSDAREDSTFTSRTGTAFDRKIATAGDIQAMVGSVVKKTTTWPTVSQSLKGILTAGPANAVRYALEKRAKGKVKKG